MPRAAARSLRARGACLGARRRPRVCFIRSAIAGVPRIAWAAQVWAPAAAHGALGSAWLDLAWPGPTRLDRLHGLTTASGALRGRPQATFRVTPLPTGPRLDRPGTANWLAGRSPPRPEPTVRVCGTPRERLPHARRAAGPSPPTSTTAQGPGFGWAPATASGYKTCLRADPHHRSPITNCNSSAANAERMNSEIWGGAFAY